MQQIRQGEEIYNAKFNVAKETNTQREKEKNLRKKKTNIRDKDRQTDIREGVRKKVKLQRYIETRKE